jgi:hypothetical protein
MKNADLICVPFDVCTMVFMDHVQVREGGDNGEGLLF